MPHPTDGESSSEESADDSNRYDDAEEDAEIDFQAQMQAQAYAQAAAIADQYGEDDDDDDENEDGDADNDEDDEAEEVEAVSAVPAMVQYHGIRGKPEAMASAFAASSIEDGRDEGEVTNYRSSVDADAMIEATAVVAEPVLDTPGNDKLEAVDAHAIPDPEFAVAVKMSPSKKKKKTSKKSTPSAKKTPKSTASLASSPTLELEVPSLDDPMEPITDAEYENLVHLMSHFCKVPLLAEFSRPVTLLHPELQAAYSKIIKHPIDLGKVCRKIRRRAYKNTREVQLDMWRIFSNCVKYHSHPSNKEAVPSFVSIALHLREYWNNLFQEFMLPSDAPNEANTAKSGPLAAKFIRETYATREEDRKKRLIVSGLTCMSPACLRRTAEKIRAFLDNQGRVDRLDEEPLFPGMLPLTLAVNQEDLKDLAIVAERINAVSNHLLQLSQDNAEYTVDQFDTALKACYAKDVFENNTALKFRVRNRVNRLVGKTLVPINEANSRGVTQSCIWGCMAAAIWARESSKKPFWPALVLGILAPDDQKEDWHWALTERNEMRLPEALRTQLSAGKRKAEQALKRQGEGLADPQSFFLVEFLGTHEFIWVRETDIVESFDPDDDPNNKAQAAKKKRTNNSRGSSLVGSKKYQAAIEEAGWALEEFESQLQDACGDLGEQDEDGEDDNYSYPVLCVSDDEADDAYQDNDAMTASEIDEANELIATRGLIDFSANGRKNAKKRALALKKQKQEAEKKQKLEKAKKVKAEQTKKKKKQVSVSKTKERQERMELKEIEKRRRKRARDREKALSSRKKTTTKRRRPNEEAEVEKIKEGGALTVDKRARATAIVRGYLTRMSKDKEYTSLGLSGVMSMPASMIDSSGLLGMALAFRAAAGELSMPEESGDQEQPKPWDAITINDAMSENERMEALHRQAELLEDEIKRVRSATKARLYLAEEAERARQQMIAEIFREEEAARSNPFKKRKKVVGSSGKSADDSPMGASDVGKDDNDDETKESTIELGTSHVTETPPRENVASTPISGTDKWSQ